MVAMAMDIEEDESGVPKRDPRLVIRSLELENFKSYAGVQRIGPLHKRFNAVVGPNGSGKSNIIDAMMFVFGKKATKLRLRRVSDVIHKSSTFPDLNHARVTVHMQDILDKEGEDYDLVAGSEFSITRTASMDNKSEYYVNSDKASFKEVIELLKGKGIDLNNNRFLILQGEIEMISQMKPKSEEGNQVGFLEYFEEIIGTDGYVGEINELNQRISTLDSSTLLMKKRLGAVETRCKNLEGPRKEAEAYLSKSAKIQSNKICVLSHSQLKFREKESSVKSKLEEHLIKVRDVEDSNAGVMEVEKEEKIRIDSCSKQLADLQKKLKEADKKFAEFEKKDVELLKKKQHVEAKLKKILDDEEKRKEELSASNVETQTAENEIPILQDKIETLRTTKEKEEEALKRMQKEIHGELEVLQQELSNARNALMPFNERMEQVKMSKKRVDAEHETMLEKRKAAVDRLGSMQGQLKEAQESIGPKQQAMAQMESVLAALRERGAEAHNAVLSLNHEREQLEASIRGVREQEEEKRRTLDSMTSQNQTMELLMQAKRSGQIPGFYGVLGHMGAVEAKYDIPMSQACPQLDSYVVETMDEAIKAGNILRNAKARVVRFIPLDRIAYLNNQMIRGFRAPQGAKRLFDLVQVADERLRVAFYYACRDTLVVENLDVGMTINTTSQKFKIVTFRGELIETSGAMTGGGGAPRGGRIRIGSSPPALIDPQVASSQLQEITSELDSMVQDLNRAQEQAGKAKEDLRNIGQEVQKIERDIPKAQSEIEATQAQIHNLSGSIQKLEHSTQVTAIDNRRLRELESESDQCASHLQSIEEECMQERARESAAQQKIDDAGGPQMISVKERVAQLGQEIKATEDGIAIRKAQLSGAAKSNQRAERDAAKCEKQKCTLENEKHKVEKQVTELEEVAKGVLIARQQLQAQVQEQEDVLTGSRQKFEETSRKGNSAREAVARLDIERKGIQLQLDGIVKQLSNYSQQIAEHKAKFTDLEPDYPVPELSDEDARSINVKDLENQCAILARELEDMNPQSAALQEYRERKAELDEHLKEISSVKEQRKEMEGNVSGLEKRRLQEFLTGFRIINMKLKEVFKMLTVQGQAELELVDTMDPFSDGIEFTVRPPQKAWKSISNLSGGEKTLSSLSLVLALHHYKPSPLYVMDEIDAALDWRNVAIVARCVSEHTKAAQFLIISLRDQMFGLADRLTGVSKVRDATRTLTMDPSAFHMVQADHDSEMEE